MFPVLTCFLWVLQAVLLQLPCGSRGSTIFQHKWTASSLRLISWTDGPVCVTKLEPVVLSAAVPPPLLSRGKFLTFSCNHLLIARDCHRREGLLFTCQLGVHCVPGSLWVWQNLCFLKSFELELRLRRSTHVPSLVFSCFVFSGSFTLLNELSFPQMCVF